MPGIEDLVTGGLPILGGLLGNIFGSNDRSLSIDQYKKAIQQIQALGIPPELAGPIVLQQYKQAGQLTPELEQAINQDKSAVADIKEDPSTRDASMQALQMLQNTGHTGLNAEDRAAYNKLRTQSNSDTTSRLNSIVQNMQSRGQAGGGAELAAKLSAAQSGANRESQSADDVAADASRRALSAITNAGNLGEQIRGQDFNVANTKATAADQMNRFNIGNQMATNQRNVAAQNNAQQSNLSNLQNTNNANTTQNNSELNRQNQAKMTDYQNKAGYAQMQADAMKQLGDIYGNQAKDTSGMLTGIGGGLGKMAGNYFQNQQNQDNFNKIYNLNSDKQKNFDKIFSLLGNQ